MNLSGTVSEIDNDLIEKFSNPPLVFCTPTEGVLLGIGYRHWGSKAIIMGLPCRERSLTISSLFSHVDRMHQRNRRTPGDSRLRLCIASRGKNEQGYQRHQSSHQQLLLNGVVISTRRSFGHF